MKTWRERIVEARTRGRFTEEDVAAARDYLTCAIAEQAMCGRIFNYVPLGHFISTPAFDRRLWELGGLFPGAVVTGDFNEAEAVLNLIEDRALEIKRECSPTTSA